MKRFFFLACLLISSLGYSQVSLPIDFQSTTINYDLGDFGGSASGFVVDPTDPGNTVVQTNKPDFAELWAGVTAGNTGLTGPIPFSVSNTKMTVRVWSPDAGIPIRLKVEDKNDPTISVETEAMTTTALVWETLEFDFSNQAAGTAVLNLDNTYDKVSIFFNFGTTGAMAGNKTYFWDDVDFVDIPPTSPPSLPITFEVATNFDLVDFGGNNSTIIIDPTDLNNTVARTIKTDAAGASAGTIIGENGLDVAVPFSDGNTKITVRVWSPDAGIPVRLKIENVTDPNISVETEAMTTMAMAWETLEFDFANEASGTDPIDFANAYERMVIFFNFGTTGAMAGEKTYYWDDVIFDEAPILTQPTLPIDFESTTVDYDLTDFGGNTSMIVVDPTDPANTVVQTTKADFAELWAGTTASDAGLAAPVPFVDGSTKMTVRVWSPDAGIPIRLKAEDKTDPTISVETEAMTTVAMAWETLEFDFANQAAGTAAINFANTYDKVSIFFNFGTTGAMAGEKTYFWDDVAFDETIQPTLPSLPIDFESMTIDYDLTDFGGNTSMIVVDPTDPNNTVVQTTKADFAELWAGTTASDAGLAAPVPFVDGSTKMTVRVWSPDAGIPIRLKAEDKTDPTISVETEAMTTVAMAWETLEFDFSNEATGTAAINFANTYDKVSIFFNFGTTGAMAGEKTYFWDDVAFDETIQPTLPSLPIDFESMTIDYDLTDFGGNTSMIVVDPTDPNNTVVQTTKADFAELWAGTTASDAGLAAPIPFVDGSTKMTVRVWSPDAGIPIRLKAEDKTDPTISVETEAMTTVAMAWETLEFDFANQAAGTAAINFANTYDKVSIFFNFGTTGAMAGEKTYFWDDVAFDETIQPTLPSLPIDFESMTIDYDLTDFGGNTSMIVVDPTDPNNTVVQTTKADFAELWAGTTASDAGLAAPVPFVDGSTKMTVRVWSPDAGIPIRLKAEDKTDPTISVETEAMTTVAMAWETLEFDFANQAAGTAAINFANTYDKVSIFFNFGTTGAMAGEKTYFWDDVAFDETIQPTLPSLPIDFESMTIDYDLTDFGGNTSMIVVDPTDPNNTVVQTTKADFAELWAGTTASDAGLAAPVPFVDGSTKMTVRVWSPDAGIPIRLKAEDKTDPTISVETEAMTTVAMAWETLEFDFANQAAGTAAINFANTYDKVSIFFNFGTTGAMAGEKTYFWDDVAFDETIQPTLPSLPIDFESMTIDYDLTDFGGNTSMIVVDPTDPNNTVVQTTKADFAELWAGTTASDAGLAAPVPFVDGSTKMTVRVWSPDAGIPIRLKAEDKTDPTISVETEAMTTVAMAWETLEFDFANQAAGTAAINFANTYDKVSIFFNFGTTGAMAGEKTYFWDDVAFDETIQPTLPSLPIDFESMTIDYDLTDFGGNTSMIVVDPTDPNNTVVQTTKADFAELWAGTTASDAGLAAPVPFVDGSTKMTVRVWSPDAGIPIRLKAEDKTDPTISVETEAMTTVAMAWETLEFDFSNEAMGTAAINFANTYDKVSIFFNFGTTGAMAGEKTYFWDDVAFVEVPQLVTPSLPIGFEDPATIDYALGDFGGNSSMMVVDPTDPTNTVVQTTKPDFAELWAGTTAGGNGLATPIPFVEGSTIMTVRVWSPDAGIPVRLKAEDATDPTISVETEAMTTVAMAWETLEFDFSNEAMGTAAIDFANTYDKVSIFFNFGTTGAMAGEKTYFWDDVTFFVPQLDGITLPVDFESDTIDYTFGNFGGGLLERIDNPDPSGINTSTKVARMIKNAPEPFAGSFMDLESPIDFPENPVFKMNVWAPAVGTNVLLKVENLADPGIFYEQTATTTTAMAWEELSIDFSAIDVSQTYQRVVLIFDNGTVGDGSEAFTYYVDDIRLEMGVSAPRPDLPITFEDDMLNYDLTDFGGNASMIVVDPTDPTNMVGQAIKTDGAELWAGTTIGNSGLENAIPFTATETQMTVRVWSPDAGIPIRLKVEDATDPTISVETEAVTTVAMAWETLEFDFSNEAAGTAMINLANTYDKISIFFNFGTTGAMAGEKTYFWDDMEFGPLVGIEVLDAAANGIKVSPNPASTEVNIEFPADLNGTAKIQLLDMNGRLVQYVEVADQQTQLELNNPVNGMYFLRIESDKKVYVQKLMIAK